MPAEMAFRSTFGKEGPLIKLFNDFILSQGYIIIKGRIDPFGPIHIHKLKSCIIDVTDFLGDFILQGIALIDINA